MHDEAATATQWHKLFGLALQEVLGRVGCHVGLEVDLSHHRQLLDCLVIRCDAPIPAALLPDGLQGMPRFTLITFKSRHEPVDEWTLKELTGHYVNVRKQNARPDGSLLQESEFLLVAVSTRAVVKLQGEIPLEPLGPGIYLARRGSDAIRIVVLNEVGDRDQNALWDVFSVERVQCERGAVRFPTVDSKLSTLLSGLLQLYLKEGVGMPYTFEQLEEEVKQRVLKTLTTEELLSRLPAEERLRGLPAEERLRGLPAEERLRGLPAEEFLKVLPAEERLRGLSVAEIEEVLRKRQKEAKDASPNR